MRKLIALAAFAAASFALAAEPVYVTDLRAPKLRPVKAPPHLVRHEDGEKVEDCCGGESRKLGRARPKSQYAYGNFLCVVGQDGKKRFFPRLSRHVDTALRKAPPPASVDWSAKAPAVLKRMYLNDQYGDCVIASRYHAIGFMSAADGGPALEADDKEVLAAYQSACGRGDNGCDMSAVNQYQQKVGLKVKGTLHKTDGSVSVDNTNQELVKAAIAVFGGLNVGIDLPADWYSSPDGADWGPTNSRIVGGHEIQAFGYDEKGVWISTWGGKRRILWPAFTSRTWVNELYATLSPDWYGSDKLAPNGIDAATLAADLQAVAGGKVPPLPDPPTPPTPPTPPQPPTPPAGNGFTGVLVYKDGALVQVVPGDTASAAGVEAELKSAGISPSVIFDVITLIADIRNKSPLATIMADVLKVVADLTAAEKQKK